jgi:hypothetical protein
MTTQEVANRFNELNQSGRWDLIVEELYAPKTTRVLNLLIQKGYKM